MSVQARFYIRQINLYGYSGAATQSSQQRADGVTYATPAPAGEVFMNPVTRGEPNAAWASATPSGQFNMTVRGEALQWFLDRNGQEVAITITDRPDDEV